MRKIIVIVSLFILATATVSMAGWGDVVDKLITNAPPPPPPPMLPAGDEPPAASNEENTQAPAGYDDDHFIQKDDFFIQTHGLENNAWIWVELAKMVTAPTPETKREAEFMKVKDGQNQWTKYFWKTRVASTDELRLGLHVIAFNDNHQGDIYKAPNKKDRARGGSWFYAKITDMSDMYRGYVTVSGNYKVSPRNLRVIVK